MNSSFFKTFLPSLVIPFASAFVISLFFIPIISNEYGLKGISLIDFPNEYGFIWPIPDSTTITSYFGKRTAPTGGASTSHSGIDIAASPGTKILSILSGTITYAGFNGAGGYTITVESDGFLISYCHVSPIFLVSVGEYVRQGNILSEVGPKNVYGVKNNPYKDSNGNPTNGATTRSTSAFNN